MTDPTPSRAAAILVVEDAGHAASALTERLGVALYGRFLAAGGYATVMTLRGREEGNERLAAAIRELAAGHDALDVVCSVHTTARAPDAWERAVPPPARKLRLVYSTACHGHAEERLAWERVGARAVVTHVGVNNPVVALPYVLSRWLDGEPLAAAVAAGYRETARLLHLALSLHPPLAGLGLPSVAGSRPVISGDADLALRPAPGAPPPLRYDPDRGGPLGLALRALAGEGVSRDDLAALLRRGRVPPEVSAAVLDRVEAVRVERARDGEAQLVVRLTSPVAAPLGRLEVEVGRRVTLRPGRLDLGRGEAVVHVEGVQVRLGPARVGLSRLGLSPALEGGHRLRVDGAVWGVVPVHRTLRLGGPATSPLVDDGPLLA